LDDETRQSLLYKGIDISGSKPVLRFYTKFNTVLAADGGFVEISTDQGQTWAITNDYIIGGPNGELSYSTFAIPSLASFSGLQEEWTGAFIDMSAYNGQNVWLRWRFGSDDTAGLGTTPNGQGTVQTFFPGWYIDDLQLLDIKEYNGQACINSDNNNGACTEMMTTYVDADIVSSTKDDLAQDGYSMILSPNPADDQVTVKIGSILTESAVLSLKTIDGKVISSQGVDIKDNETQVNIDVNNLTGGVYLISLQSRNKALTKKLIVN